MLYNYIAVEGVIGAGKTTLARMLADELNGKLILEEFATNTFLEYFYKQPERYAFPVEVGFLAERFQQLENEFKPDLFSDFIISDYHFAKSNVFAKQNLNKAHYGIFKKLFDIFTTKIPSCDLLIYLDKPAEQLHYNIKRRGRQMEQEISLEYLNKLRKGYTQFLKETSDIPVIILDMDQLDFVRDTEVYANIKSLLSQPHEVGITHVRPAKNDLNL